MSESFFTSWAIVILFTRRHSNIIRVVVNIFMTLQQLFLSESLIAELALKGLLVAMDEHVRLKMSRRDRSVSAMLTSITFLAFVGLCMDFVAVAVREVLIASFALDGNIARVQLLNVNSKISLPATRGRTKLTLKNWFFTH